MSIISSPFLFPQRKLHKRLDRRISTIIQQEIVKRKEQADAEISAALKASEEPVCWLLNRFIVGLLPIRAGSNRCLTIVGL